MMAFDLKHIIEYSALKSAQYSLILGVQYIVQFNIEEARNAVFLKK